MGLKLEPLSKEHYFICHLRGVRVGRTIRSLSFYFLLLFIVGVLTACGQDKSGFQVKSIPGASSPEGSRDQNPPSLPPPSDIPDSSDLPNEKKYSVAFPPLWEKPRQADGVVWTQFAFETVDVFGDGLLKGTSDIEEFCPKYFTLTRNEKINFWVYLVSAIVKFESGFNPASRFLETTMGTDPVTQLPVWSEGLLQLSYQDSNNYSFCKDLDWNKDRVLSPTDPKKSILDPFINLRCGIRILNHQVIRKNLISVRGYWSVLFPTGTKIAPIRALSRQQKYCL